MFLCALNNVYRYSNYEVYGDVAIADSAQTRKRYSSDSLFGVIVDIEMLARYLLTLLSSLLFITVYPH